MEEHRLRKLQKAVMRAWEDGNGDNRGVGICLEAGGTVYSKYTQLQQRS